MIFFKGEIKSGIPSFQVPPFSFDRPIISSSSNRTNFDSVMNQNGTESVTFLAILADLGTGLAMIPIIAILEQVAIAKAFGKFIFENIDVNFFYLRNS